MPDGYTYPVPYVTLEEVDAFEKRADVKVAMLDATVVH